MDQLTSVVAIIALTMGTAWASGINLYAAVLMLGFMGMTGGVTLPPGLEILANPAVLLAAGFMYVVEYPARTIHEKKGHPRQEDGPFRMVRKKLTLRSWPAETRLPDADACPFAERGFPRCFHET